MYDLIVIGAGPGGYVAAIRAAQLGLSVALIERESAPGGTCLHRGCIPSKAYLAAAEVVEVARRAEKMGITFGTPQVDLQKLVASKDGKVERLSRGLADLVRGNKVNLITGKGEAVVESSHRVRIGDERLESRFILLATGTEPVRPGNFPFNGVSILTTDELFRFTDLPRSLLVVGGGVSGCEIACAFNLFGVAVTLVELLPTILPKEERMAVKGLQTVLEKRGVRFKTGCSVRELKETDGKVQASLSDASEVVVDRALVAIGRRLGADRLGLGALGVHIEGGFVKVNERMETSIAGVTAVGDLVGTTMLAHGAMAEGICAVENMAGNPTTIDYGSIPRVVYTIPPIASIGSTEEELKKKGTPYRAGRFSYLASGKALCDGEGEGFAQILVGTGGIEKDKVLGATIFGAHAEELIHEVALVMRNKLVVEALIGTVHAHPSLSEIIHEAAEDAVGRAIHKLTRVSHK